jgi:hypothetical protein
VNRDAGVPSERISDAEARFEHARRTLGYVLAPALFAIVWAFGERGEAAPPRQPGGLCPLRRADVLGLPWSARGCTELHDQGQPTAGLCGTLTFRRHDLERFD